MADRIYINFLLGSYQKVGDVSLVRLFGFNVFQKVSKIYNIFGMQIDLNKEIK